MIEGSVPEQAASAGHGAHLSMDCFGLEADMDRHQQAAMLAFSEYESCVELTRRGASVTFILRLLRV